MEAQTSDTSSKINTIAVTTILVIVLTLVSLFIWRVYYYYGQIQNGNFSGGSLSSAALSISETIKQLPEVPDGNFIVTSTDDPSLGLPDAPVTIVEFADFGCPYSRQSSFVLRALARKYDRNINYIYRDFPITELHPEAKQAAMAGECAHEQGKFWEYHDKLYQNQSNLSDSALIRYARELGMDESAFTNCLDSGKYSQEVEADYADGLEAGVRGTPTFFINGNRIPGSIPEDVLDAIIGQIILTANS